MEKVSGIKQAPKMKRINLDIVGGGCGNRDLLRVCVSDYQRQGTDHRSVCEDAFCIIHFVWIG
jgi:hypothetical protein